MITGDNPLTAQAIAQQVGIERVLAEVLPGDKAAEVKKLQEQGLKTGGRSQLVAMVGDGINDAPALAQADVGIAIGTGTDVAMAAAGITLISGDLRGVARAISLSRGTLQTIVQNLFWAFFYNVLLIPIAAFGFLIPMVAAGAMAFSSIFVVTNSLRLRGYKVQILTAPKSLPGQILELAPRLLVSGLALGALIGISIGWLQPGGYQMTGSGMKGRPISYHAVITTDTAIEPGKEVVLNIEVLDPSNNRLSSFEGRDINIAIAKRDLSSMDLISMLPDSGSFTVKAGDMSMGGPPVANSDEGADSQAGLIKPEVTFPSDGQYVVFISFWPVGMDEVTTSVPISVGSSLTQAAALKPDPSLTQSFDDLTLTLIPSEPLKARRNIFLSFDVVNSQGIQRADEVQAITGVFFQFGIVDEKLTTFFTPTDYKPPEAAIWGELPKAGHV